MWQWEEEDKEEQAGDEEEQSCRAVTTGQWWCRGYSVVSAPQCLIYILYLKGLRVFWCIYSRSNKLKILAKSLNSIILELHFFIIYIYMN
jgi:hypothetical protein